MKAPIWLWRLAVASVLCAVSAADSRAAQVRLAWDPPTNNVDGSALTDLAGYKILHGTASGVYTVVTNVGNVTTSLVANLTEGQTYYFVVQAYNAALGASANSSELMWQVPDVTPPIITPPSARTLPAGSAGTASIPNLVTGIVVTDNVTAVTNILVTQAPAAGTAAGVGVTAVTVTARDQAGNTAQAVVQVTVVDQTPPVIQSPTQVTLTAGTNNLAAVPNYLDVLSVSDNCTPRASLVLTQTPTAGAQVAVGTTTVTIKATDVAGNQAQTTTTLIVLQANRAPVVSAGADNTIHVNQSASLQGSATDDNLPAGSIVSLTWTMVSGPGTATFVDASAATTSVRMSEVGTYVLCLTASDGALSASDTVTLTVLPQVVPSKPINLRIVAQ